jgi:hypothetical protein
MTLAATVLIPSPAKPDINPRRESLRSKSCLINSFTAFLQTCSGSGSETSFKNVLSERREVGVIKLEFVMACMNQVAETRLLLPKRVADMIEYCIKGDDETEYIH